MKVVMVVPNLHIGGLERMVLHLCRGLQAKGVELVVFGYDFTPGRASLLQSFEQAGIRVESFAKGPGISLKVVYRLARLLIQERADVVHSHDLGPLLYTRLARWLMPFMAGGWSRRPRHIHTQHTLIHLTAQRLSGLKSRVYDRVFATGVDTLVAVSSAIETHYRRGSLARVSRIANGVAFSERAVITRDEMRALRHRLIASVKDVSARERLETLLDARWLVSVARIHESKGQLESVRIWNETQVEFRNSHALIFLGEEAEPGQVAKLEALIAQSSSAERVVCAGVTHEPLSWMLAADTFISTSHHEGMPLAPLEAAGSGRSVVLSNIPGHQFLSDRAAFLSMTDPAQMADELERFEAENTADTTHGDQRREELWAQSARLRAEFGLEKMTERYLGVYERGLQ